MTTPNQWKRPTFAVGQTYEFSVTVGKPIFKLRATRSDKGMTKQVEVCCPGRIQYGDRQGFSEAADVTLQATLPCDPAKDLYPLGMLFLESDPPDAAAYVAQSETIVTHLAQAMQGGRELVLEFVGRVVAEGQLEIIEFTCEYP